MRRVVLAKKPRIKRKGVVKHSSWGEHSYVFTKNGREVKLVDPDARLRKPYLSK